MRALPSSPRRRTASSAAPTAAPSTTAAGAAELVPVTAQAARNASEPDDDARARPERRERAATTARPASAALSRCPARSRGSRAGRRGRARRRRRRSRGRAPSSAAGARRRRRASAASARPTTGRSGTTRADSLAWAVSARISALTPRRSSSRRASDRSSAGRSPPARSCSEMAAAAKRARCPSAAASAVADVLSARPHAGRPARTPRPPRRRAAARGHERAIGRAAGAQLRRDPAQGVGQLALERAFAAGTPRMRRRSASGARFRAMRARGACDAPRARLSRTAITPLRSAAQRASTAAAATSCQPRPRRSTPWIETQPALAVAPASDLHDDVERRGNLLAHRGVRQLETRHQREQLDPPERVLGPLRVDGRERPVVARRHRLEHVERLAAAHLADDQSVGPHPQRVAHELPDADLARALETRAARLQARDVRAIDAQLGGVLDGHDPLARVDARGERAQQRRLAARRAAADDDREPRAHAAIEQVGVGLGERAELDQLGQRERSWREPAQRQERSVRRERRQHDVQARAVGETRVDHRLRVVEPASRARGQANAGVAQRAGVVEAQRRALQTAPALDPDLGRPVRDHLGDARIVERASPADPAASPPTPPSGAPSNAAAALSCARSQRLTRRARRRARRARRTPPPAAAVPARARARHAESGLTVASSGSPVCSASACAARGLRDPVATTPARRAERPSRASSSDIRRAPRAPRASVLATIATRLARSSTGMVSTPTRAPQSTIARRPLATARSRTRAIPRSSIEIRLLRQRRRRQARGTLRRWRARPRAPPAWPRARRRCAGTRPAPPRGPRRPRRHRPSRAPDRARTPVRAQPPSATAQVVVPMPPPAPSSAMWPSSSSARAARRASKQPAAASACRSAGASIGRSTTPTAPQSSACCAARFRTRRRDQEDARVGSARALAADEVARSRARGVGRQEHVGVGGSAQPPGVRPREGRRARRALPLSSARIAAEQGEPDDHGALAAQQQPHVAPTSPGRERQRDRRRSAQRHRDAARALTRGREQLETRALRPVRRSGRGSRRRRSGLGAAGACPEQIPAPGRVRPLALRCGAATCAVARAQGAAHEEIAAGEVDLRATTGQPVESADHRRRAIGRRRSARRRRRLGGRSRLRRARAGARAPWSARSPPCGSETQREGDQREREAERGQPVLAQPVEQAEAAHGATVPAAASGRRSVKRAPRSPRDADADAAAVRLGDGAHRRESDARAARRCPEP